MLTQKRENTIRYVVRTRTQTVWHLSMLEDLLTEIDRLRAKVTEQRVLASMVVEDTIKLYAKAKELQHAVEKGKESQGRLAEHQDGNGRWSAAKTGSGDSPVEGGEKPQEKFCKETRPFDIS